MKKKAFLGAAIGTGLSVASGIFKGIAQKKAAKKQAALEQKQAEEEAQSLQNQTRNAYFTQAEIANEERAKLYDNEMVYAKGGTKRIGSNVQITKGGTSKPIGGNAHVLVGRKHSTGGIDIKTGSDGIEAEGGEVVFKDGNNLKILSDYPISDSGVSPAKKALANPNEVKQIYNEQEHYKMKKGLDADTTTTFACGGKKKAACGGKKKAALGNILKIGAQVANVATPIASGLIGLSATNKRKAPKEPTLYSSYRMPTKVDNGAQLQGVANESRDMRTAISRNTSSSATSIAREQSVINKARQQSAEISENAANKERDYVRQNLAREQEVANANIDKRNSYQRYLNNFENKQQQYKAEAINSMVTGVGDAATSYLDKVNKDEYNQKVLDIAKDMSVRPKQQTTTKVDPTLEKGTDEDVLEYVRQQKSKGVLSSGFAKGGKKRITKRKCA